jgi:hypothetical protein
MVGSAHPTINLIPEREQIADTLKGAAKRTLAQPLVEKPAKAG